MIRRGRGWFAVFMTSLTSEHRISLLVTQNTKVFKKPQKTLLFTKNLIFSGSLAVGGWVVGVDFPGLSCGFYPYEWDGADGFW